MLETTCLILLLGIPILKTQEVPDIGTMPSMFKRHMPAIRNRQSYTLTQNAYIGTIISIIEPTAWYQNQAFPYLTADWPDRNQAWMFETTSWILT